MSRIKKVKKLTDGKYINMYELDGINRLGGKVNYYVASRNTEIEELQLMTHQIKPDGVVIYALSKEQPDKVLLVRQYRYSIDEYIYEFPAGLIDEGETVKETAVREVKEETGMNLEIIETEAMYERPFYPTIGMTDECLSMIYGYASGTASKAFLEDNEDMDVVFVDRKEAKRILKEERVALMCAYMLMHFIKDEEPFAFLK